MTETATPDRLVARDVTVKFGGLTALKDVSISVPQGGIVGLVGPNGAGKSTLFDVLSGLRRPDTGTVTLNSEDVTHASAQARAMRGLARTFQHPELFQGLTVHDHLALARRVRHTPGRVLADAFTLAGFRRPPKDEESSVSQLLSELSLTSVARRMAVGLPVGAARLVEVGRALAFEPSVLILDEGSSGLDARETDELVTVLRRVAKERDISLLLVEHDVELVMGLCDRIFVLDFGVCIAEGTPVEIRANELVHTAYLGEEHGLEAMEEKV
jgi:branched-chain amino acid transport system ATP-binding protein